MTLVSMAFGNPIHANSAPTTTAPVAAEIGNMSEKDAEAFVAGLQKMLKVTDPKDIKEIPNTIANNMVHYPLRWFKDANTKNATMIKTPAEFVKNYSEIMSAKVIDAILNQDMKNLFINAQGCMIGNGQVWLDERGIKTISNF
ncbi:hypothetical protein [Candidatus Bealeia paramacronuclearis]